MKNNDLYFKFGYMILIFILLLMLFSFLLFRRQDKNKDINKWIPRKLISENNKEIIVDIPYSFFLNFNIKNIVEPISLNRNKSKIRMDVNWFEWNDDINKMRGEEFQRGLNKYIIEKNA